MAAKVSIGDICEAMNEARSGQTNNPRRTFKNLLRIVEAEGLLRSGDAVLSVPARKAIAGAYYLATGPSSEPVSLEDAIVNKKLGLTKLEKAMFWAAYYSEKNRTPYALVSAGAIGIGTPAGEIRRRWTQAQEGAVGEYLLPYPDATGAGYQHISQGEGGAMFAGRGFGGGSGDGNNIVATLLWLAGGVVAIEFIARATGQRPEDLRR